GNLGHDFGVLLQVSLGSFAALANFLVVVGKPGAGFLDDVVGHRQVQNVAGFANAFVVHNVEFGFAERRRNFIFDHLDGGKVTNHTFAGLNLANAPDVHAHAGVEFESVAASGRFWVAKHHADLHTDLVDENNCGFAAIDDAG